MPRLFPSLEQSLALRLHYIIKSYLLQYYLKDFRSELKLRSGVNLLYFVSKNSPVMHCFHLISVTLFVKAAVRGQLASLFLSFTCFLLLSFTCNSHRFKLFVQYRNCFVSLWDNNTVIYIKLFTQNAVWPQLRNILVSFHIRFFPYSFHLVKVEILVL